MPTVVRNVEVETRRAWEEYSARLQGLEGPDYDRAEQEAWARLQEILEELQGPSVPGPQQVG